MLIHAFFRSTRKRMDDGKPVLFSLDVLRSTRERSIVACMALMLFIGTATSFLLPLYMQVVQGLSGFETSLSIVPYTLSIFVANTQVSRLYDRFSPAAITRVSFVVRVPCAHPARVHDPQRLEPGLASSSASSPSASHRGASSPSCSTSC